MGFTPASKRTVGAHRSRPAGLRRRLGWGAPAVCLLLLLGWPLSPARGQDLLTAQKDQAVRRYVVGTWMAEVGRQRLVLDLTGDGRFTLNNVSGKYSVEGDTLKLLAADSEASYQIGLDRNKMDLSGGGLGAPLSFIYQPEATGALRRLFDWSPESVRRKLYRVLLILGVVLLVRLFLSLLQTVSRLMVVSERGPLRLIYRQQKNRALTIHSLVLNLIKYVVYFAAFGFILGELGVNYTAYLASLSVIGLAIGFGSQGLVQDVVTGFFIIFEGQFDVGDMVEMSGQTGVVEELGLRMTRLRNYLGELISIPNRNIALVGNFLKGAQHAYVDVAASGPDAAKAGAECLKQCAAELARQFKGVVLRPPDVVGPVSLATGETFLRVHVPIWPQQQWVVEQQFVPRLREILKTRGLEVPGDRIVTFYHARMERPVSPWGRGLGKLKRFVPGARTKSKP